MDHHKQQCIEYHKSVAKMQNQPRYDDETVHWNKVLHYYKNKRNTFQYLKNMESIVSFKLEVRQKIIDHMQKQLEHKLELIRNHVKQVRDYYHSQNRKTQILTNFTYESCHEKQQQTLSNKTDEIVNFVDQFFIKQKSLIKQTNNMLQDQVYMKMNRVLEMACNMAVQLKQDYEQFNNRVNSLQNKSNEQEKMLNNLIKQHRSDIKASKKVEKDQLQQSILLVQLLQQQIYEVSDYFNTIEQHFEQTKVLFINHQQAIKDSLQSYFEIKQNQFQYKPDQRIIQQILYQINVYSQNEFKINELLNVGMIMYLNQQEFRNKEQEYQQNQSIKKTLDYQHLKEFFGKWNIEMQTDQFLVLDWIFGHVQFNSSKVEYNQQSQTDNTNQDQKIIKRKSILGNQYLGYQKCCLLFTLDYQLLVFHAEDDQDSLEQVDVWRQNAVKQIKLYDKNYSAWENDADKWYVVQIRNSKNNLMSQGQEFYFKSIDEWEKLTELLKCIGITEFKE